MPKQERRASRPRAGTAILFVAVLGCSHLAGARPAQSPREGKAMTIADFAQGGEIANWKLENSGPKSKVQVVAGPDGRAAVQVTCVYEPQLQPQVHSPSPYMPFRRGFDGEAAAKGGFTRLYFWHKGNGVQVVLNEKDRGDVYYTKVGASKEWRRVFVCFGDLTLGWSQGGTGKGSFDLARMASFHLAVSTPPGKSRVYNIADMRLERAKQDLSPLLFIGGTTPVRLDLYPRTLSLPVNRTQPLLMVVRNEERCGLAGVEVELTLAGAGTLSPHGDHAGHRLAESLRLITDQEGKAQARLHPGKTVGEKCVIAARIMSVPAVAAVRADFVTVPELRKIRLGEDGFFVAPDGRRVIPLGGQFLPQVKRVVNGGAAGVLGVNTLAAEESAQRTWFEYLRQQRVNCLRGYWAWRAPLKLGPDGEMVPGTLHLDGKINEPVVAALERTLALAGEYGIGVTLTIANCARPFIVPRGKVKKPKRALMHEAHDFLREIVPRLMFNPNIWAYELTNEQASGTFDWSERFVRTIQELDEVTPVMISHCGGGLVTADPLPWMSQTSIDVYQPHFYPGRSNTSPEVDAGLFQEIHANAMHGPKPWLLGESGGYSGHPPLSPPPGPVEKSYLARDCIWFALLNRAIGAFYFCGNHEENAQVKVAAEIVPLVDWQALNDARAMVGVAVPRDISKATFFRSADGKRAIGIMADYARWAMETGVTVDFVLDAKAYPVRRSVLQPFDPPGVRAPFKISKGYQLKYRMSKDGELVVGYLRNAAKISLLIPLGKSRRTTGSYIRVRERLSAEIEWELPDKEYTLTVWDLDTGEKRVLPDARPAGTWRQEQTDHDFLLLWRSR